MVTVGGAISGYCEIGSAVEATSPAIVMMIASTLAKMGRSMKNREKLPMSGFGQRAGPAGAGLLGAAAGAGAAAGVGPGGTTASARTCTAAPGRILIRLSTMAPSPGFKPPVTSQS